MAKVAWVNIAEKAAFAYPAPQKFIPPKDRNGLSKGFLSCPALRHYFDNTYMVCSAFTLRLRRVDEQGGFTIRPVYPFTSIAPNRIAKFVKIQPRNTWRKPERVVLQIPTPYLFFADEPIEVEQIHPSLGESDSLNWNLIPGRFDIYAWQRALNFALEWDSPKGDLVLRVGDPMYFLRFHGERPEKHELVEQTMNNQLRERLRLFRGIASVRRGSFGLIADASKAREHIKLME